LGNDKPSLEVPAQKGRAVEQPGAKFWLYVLANSIKNSTIKMCLLFIMNLI
jgi:hypothetical protein